MDALTNTASRAAPGEAVVANYALKKSLDSQQQMMTDLLSSLPTYNNPPNLGQGIDVKA
ncbi:YjfB family protein [Chitinibacteraceae bacterium HSL-7]